MGLSYIGVTGTKGKSTTTYLVDFILSEVGLKTALVGTIKKHIGGVNYSSGCVDDSLTTPGFLYLKSFFAECFDRDIDFVVMEVSSHAIVQDRIRGIGFDFIGFTNLGSDHLDYHKNLEDYKSSKYKIFSYLKKDGFAVLNVDDSVGLEFSKRLDGKNKVGISKGSFFEIKKNDLSGLSIYFKEDDISIEIKSVFGDFNAYNISMAYSICRKIGLDKFSIKNALENFRGIPGRLQSHILKNGAKAFVDFAHNSSSMKSVLSTLRLMTDDLIVVFGCGGDRDVSKRPEMGSIASLYCDKIIVTNDNPRSEDEKNIVSDIMKGINKKVDVIFDRKEAIKKAASVSNKGSIIAILGKGHENYSLRGGNKYYFNDFENISCY